MQQLLREEEDDGLGGGRGHGSITHSITVHALEPCLTSSIGRTHAVNSVKPVSDVLLAPGMGGWGTDAQRAHSHILNSLLL